MLNQGDIIQDVNDGLQALVVFVGTKKTVLICQEKPSHFITISCSRFEKYGDLYSLFKVIGKTEIPLNTAIEAEKWLSSIES